MPVSIDAALSGMLEQQRNMEAIANNIANANTTGYKRVKVHFRSLLDSAEVLQALQGDLPPEDAATSGGVETASTERVFEQGPLTESPSQLDFAILGDSFFTIRLEDGSLAYTRDGNLHADPEGKLVMADGTPLEPGVLLPETFSNVRIDEDGRIVARRPMTAEELAARDPNDVSNEIDEARGRLVLARFQHPQSLVSIGRNLYLATEASGPAIEGVTGDEGFGRIVNGFLEASNVSVGEELTTLMAASRAYQMNLAAYRTIEQMLRQAGDLAAG